MESRITVKAEVINTDDATTSVLTEYHVEVTMSYNLTIKFM